MILLISLVITLVMSLFDWMHSHKGNNSNKGRVDLHWLFIVGLLVSKGCALNKESAYHVSFYILNLKIFNMNRCAAGFRGPSKLKMQLAGGAWCLAALILTNYYSSALTSLITSTTPQPLVNSVEELASKDNVGLVVVKGYNIASNIAV